MVGVDAVMSREGKGTSGIRYDTTSVRHNRDRQVVALCQLKPGQAGEVVHMQTADKAVLQRLLAMGVIPGSRLKVEFTSPVVVFQVENTRVATDYDVAGKIKVRRIHGVQ